RPGQAGIEQLSALRKAQAFEAVAVPYDDGGIRFAQQRFAQRQLRACTRLVGAALIGAAVLTENPGAWVEEQAARRDDESDNQGTVRELRWTERGQIRSKPVKRGCGYRIAQHHGRSPPPTPRRARPSGAIPSTALMPTKDGQPSGTFEKNQSVHRK